VKRIKKPVSIFNQEKAHANQEKAHFNQEKDYSNQEKAHSNQEKAHSNQEKAHFNQEKDYSIPEKGHSNQEKAQTDILRAVFDLYKNKKSSRSCSFYKLRKQLCLWRNWFKTVSTREALAKIFIDRSGVSNSCFTGQLGVVVVSQRLQKCLVSRNPSGISKTVA
jgi:hypothetical protein